jgi:hypothetical protein
MSGLRGIIPVLLAFSLGCVSSTPGPLARAEKKTADGLVLVEDHRRGALFIKPDHGITSRHRYHLTQILMTYERDSNRFTAEQEQRIRQYVEDATIGGMIGEGSTMVTGPGSCVLAMGIGLVDVVLTEPDGSGSSTSVLATWGGVTLVVDLRDSTTGEPLLRYGRRISFPGGIQWQDDLPPWTQVRSTLDKLLLDQRTTLLRGIPESTIANTSCEPPDPDTPSTTRAY